YMYSDNTRMNAGKEHKWVPQNYGVGKLTGEEAVNDGEMMWEKLVSQYPNIRMVVSGHVLNSGTGKLVSTGKHGNKVYQMLANYQMGVKGGNGYLRIVNIDTKKRKISVRTYSPYTGQYNTDTEHQFEFQEVDF
ncbi:MAG: metallophosphatase, partial [Bacteroidales bacterium]|nr:metallophosphatase [Bacteroidales bacterium]